MGSYYIPRNTKGEGRLFYIFSTKALIYTVVSIFIGFIFKKIFNFFGTFFPNIGGVLNTIGLVLIGLFGIIGFVVGTCKIPQIEKFEITKKTSGINIDTVIMECIKFRVKKDKQYVYDVTDLIKEELEKEQKEKELLNRKEK
ncbi:MAG: hypothetical protein J6A89_03480 [Clostridia bacterium]|nr:hypothetical protein [Clostridia bacterium]